MSKIVTRPMGPDTLVAGVQFIPKGKKRPVTIYLISEFHGPTLDVYAYGSHGNSAHILNRYEPVDVVVTDRAPSAAEEAFDRMFSESTDALDRLTVKKVTS